MEKILQWLSNHKRSTVGITVAIFFTPLLVIHILFLQDSEIEWVVARWTPGDLMSYVAGFEAFIGTVALGALALWQNQQIHNQHIESLEPILSMRLISVRGMLYLTIENTGQSEAKDIQINVERIENNGQHELMLDALFQNAFELHPYEIVQGRVAINGVKSMVEEAFPKIFVQVSYIRSDINRKKEYNRTVIYDGGYSQKIVADANMDKRQIQSDIDCLARAAVRVANYLDGQNVRKIDAMDVLSDRTLQKDLASVMSAEDKSFVKSSEDNMSKSKKRKNAAKK